MKDICMLLIVNIIFMIIGIKSKNIASFIGFLRFKIVKNKVCGDEWVYFFTKDVMLKMNINYKVHIKINRKSKNYNADLVVYKNSLLIILHGNWSDDQLKFVIAHELAHIKLKHTENNRNIYFIICLNMTLALIYKVGVYIYPNSIEDSYKDLIEWLVTFIIIISFIVSSYIENIMYKKKCRQNEKDADLQAAKITGIKIAIDTITMLNDKGNDSIMSSHPTNKERIECLILNLGS